MAGGIVLPDGRRRLDAIREDYAANMRRSDIARKYGVAFQIVYQATRDMGGQEHTGGESRGGGVPRTASSTIFSKKPTPVSTRPLTVTPVGTYQEPEYVEELTPVAEDLFPPS